jgi:hypothetical protein
VAHYHHDVTSGQQLWGHVAQDYFNTNSSSPRPDRMCNGAGPKKITEWFNNSCFETAAVAQALANRTPRFEDSGTQYILNTAGVQNWDMHLSRRQSAARRREIQGRVLQCVQPHELWDTVCVRRNARLTDAVRVTTLLVLCDQALSISSATHSMAAMDELFRASPPAPTYRPDESRIKRWLNLPDHRIFSASASARPGGQRASVREMQLRASAPLQ